MPVQNDSRKQEIFKDIPGYNGDYQVSNQGRVKSFKQSPKGRILRPKSTVSGYLQVNLCQNGKVNTTYVHYLVTLTFVGERPYGLDINHKDGNKVNNYLSNLEYCTHSKNIQHGHDMGLMNTPRGENHSRAKLTKSQVLEIRTRYSDGGVTQKELAMEYGVGSSTIGEIVNRRNWTHI